MMKPSNEHDPTDPKVRQMFLNRLSDLSNLTGLRIEGGIVLLHDDPLCNTYGYVERNGQLYWANLLSEIENERNERNRDQLTFEGMDREPANRPKRIDLSDARDEDS